MNSDPYREALRLIASNDAALDELRIPRMRSNRIPVYSDAAGFGVLVPLRPRHDGGTAA